MLIRYGTHHVGFGVVLVVHVVPPVTGRPFQETDEKDVINPVEFEFVISKHREMSSVVLVPAELSLQERAMTFCNDV